MQSSCHCELFWWWHTWKATNGWQLLLVAKLRCRFSRWVHWFSWCKRLSCFHRLFYPTCGCRPSSTNKMADFSVVLDDDPRWHLSILHVPERFQDVQLHKKENLYILVKSPSLCLTHLNIHCGRESQTKPLSHLSSLKNIRMSNKHKHKG